ncbi:carbon monoxide dehydrogenase beta subunit family protein [Solibacillus sp. FSL W8-0474]|uniref:carbon monoxide dehydrogenase beta subunit family protein n=1 Tax=Solibacillus sp. FSL W8-0474 TaxID=2975336 RepID=UPI004046A46F
MIFEQCNNLLAHGTVILENPTRILENENQLDAILLVGFHVYIVSIALKTLKAPSLLFEHTTVISLLSG